MNHVNLQSRDSNTEIVIMSKVDFNYSDLNKEMLIKDAPFAWYLFDQAKLNPRYDLADYRHQAKRLEAYIDALGIALEVRQPVETWLDMTDWGSCFMLAVLAIRYNRIVLFKQALDHLNASEETHYREIVDACLWHEQSDMEAYFAALRQHASPIAQQSYVALLRVNGLDIDSQYANQFFLSQNPAVKIQLLNWIGEQGHHQYISYVQQQYIDPKTPDDYQLAFAAVRAGILLQDPVAHTQLIDMAFTPSTVTEDCLSLLFIREQDEQQLTYWLENLWTIKEIPQRVKIHGTMIAGLVDYMGYLFDAMADQSLNRIAGYAFSVITGVDIEENRLDMAETEPTVEYVDLGNEGLNQKSSNELLLQAWEEDLPCADTDACYFWWESTKANYSENLRYLVGKEITEENLLQVREKGNQGQRQLAAMYLSLHYGYHWKDPNWP